MIKRILLFFVVICVTFIASYFFHFSVLENKDLQLSFSLQRVYFFYAISAVLIYLIVTVISEKTPNQAGYGYLALMFVKIGFFLILFKSTVFSEIPIDKPEKISLVIPFLLFLSLETIFIAKLLNNK
ncbi:DUF6168 family protein [Tenacibaculum sp. C7A-26P2]|uniref:DUF6168 family protein n=1 Tax=Tenacibaculum sp. C7A-26P2 TaxID=3447504 RepID=UPI003F846E4B